MALSSSMRRRLLVLMIVIGTGLAVASLPLTPSLVARFEVVHVFGGGADGDYPFTELIQAADGALYGTTPRGGRGAGTAFRLGLAGDFAVVADFDPHSPVGAYPYAALMQSADGGLYGTTTAGGAHGKGAVFRLDSHGPVALHAFLPEDPAGCFPRAPLRQARDGFLYGIGESCGRADLGAIVRVGPGSAVSLVHSFGDILDDGATPISELLPAVDGNIYGTTSAGGAFGLGTIFRVSPAGQYEVLHSFRGDDGSDIEAGLVQAPDGSLWGAAAAGGPSGSGVLFRFVPGKGVMVVHAFSGQKNADGAVPLGHLVAARDGFFYGTTQRGGRFDRGTIYRLAPDGSFALVHTFSGLDGAHPAAALVETTDGRLFGVAADGPGQSGHGLVFAVTVQ
jgi:uncharacterized repeat protein (TIGR03803 family)